ncbi:MAG TPA: hypothetical protein VH700_17020 [Gemmatimonadales bacterium]|jgi:hypothetical protein
MRLLLGVLLAAACERHGSEEPVRPQLGMRAGEPILSAVPAAGYRINGRVSPALELTTGQVIRLDRGRRSVDSAYFDEPPWARVPESARLRGTLRASVCRTDEALCRIAAVAVDLRR